MNPLYVLEENGLDDFFRDIASNPLLSREEEQKLALRIAGGDEEAKNTLVEANLRLVVHIAKRYQGRGMELEDIVQEGVPGLMSAARKFKPNIGKFSTYATWWIRQSIQRALMERGDAIRLPVHVHEKLLAIRRASFQFQSEHGYEPSAQELADYTGKTLAHVQTLMEANFTYVSMNVSADEDLRNSSDFIGNLLDPQTPDIHETVEQNETAELVHLALECLSEKERDILKRRFGIGEYPKQQTLFEVGEAHHVTRERIRQIEVIALNKFKKAILRIQHEAIAKTRKPRRKAA